MPEDARKTAILACGAFDNAYYLDQALASRTPDLWNYPSLIDHYLASGWKRLLNPSRDFDLASYLATNPLVHQAGIEPLSYSLWHGTDLDNAPGHAVRDIPRSEAREELSSRQITIVIGMHRSGTSLCSNLLNLLGIDMSEGIEIRDSNERGQWERLELVAFHDRVLQVFDRDWYSRSHMLSLPPGWHSHPAVRSVRDEMVAWLAEQLRHTAHFGFKDPRTARLLPLWDEICAAMQLEPRYIFCIRDPAQVARSLVARDGMEAREAEYRWMVYNSHAILGIGSQPVCIIPYEDWFAKGNTNLNRLVAHLGLTRASDSTIVAAMVNRTIDSTLRHDQDDMESSALSRSLYRQIVDCASDTRFSQELRDAATAFFGFEEFVQPLLEARFAGHSLPPPDPRLSLPVGNETPRYPHSQVRLAEGLVTAIHHYSEALKSLLGELGQHDKADGNGAAAAAAVASGEPVVVCPKPDVTAFSTDLDASPETRPG